METPFNFDREINKILPPSQETLWTLYSYVKDVCDEVDEDSSDLCGQQPVVLADAAIAFNVRIHPFPEWDAERQYYKAATLAPDDGGEPYELWCSRSDIFELRGPRKESTEELGQLLISYFAPPHPLAA